MQLFERCVVYKPQISAAKPEDVCVETGFFAHAHASAGAAKTKANTRLYLILQRRADADAATSRRRREIDINYLASAPGDSIAC